MNLILLVLFAIAIYCVVEAWKTNNEIEKLIKEQKEILKRWRL